MAIFSPMISRNNPVLSKACEVIYEQPKSMRLFSTYDSFLFVELWVL